MKKISINYSRLIITIIVLLLLILLVVFMVNKKTESEKRSNDSGEMLVTSTEDNNSVEPLDVINSQEEQINYENEEIKKERLDKVFEELKNGNDFSNNKKIVIGDEFVSKYGLADYKERLDGFAIIDENETTYQEAVVVVSYSKDDYDPLLLNFIGRLEDIKKEYGEKYGELFRQNKNVILKQEVGRVVFIVSENAPKLEAIIKTTYEE